MIDKDALLDYMARFRLECHYRLDMVPGDIKELPIFMYKGAQASVKESMVAELNLSDEDAAVIGKVGDFFLETLQELDHYTKTDDLIMKKINDGDFTNQS